MFLYGALKIPGFSPGCTKGFVAQFFFSHYKIPGFSPGCSKGCDTKIILHPTGIEPKISSHVHNFLATPPTQHM